MASQRSWADESQAFNALSTPDASPGSTRPLPLSDVKVPTPDTSRYPSNVDITNTVDFRRVYDEELSSPRRSGGGRRSTGRPSSQQLKYSTDDFPALSRHGSLQPSSHFDKFLLLKFDDSVDLDNIDLFRLFDDISACAGSPLKNMYRNNRHSYVLETTSSLQVQSLLTVTNIAGCTVTISVFAALNQCKGVITCRELHATPTDKIQDRTAAQGVTYVRRVKRWDNGVLVPTHTYVFTFNLTYLPAAVKVAHLNLPLRLYIDNPRKCHKCQRYGHAQTRCNRESICYRCSTSLPAENHNNPCDRTPLCCHCQGPHPTSFRGCPEYKKQVNILTVAAMDHVTISEAVKRVNESGLFSHKSFAAVTKKAAATHSRRQDASQANVSTGTNFHSANNPARNSLVYASALVSPRRSQNFSRNNEGFSSLQQSSAQLHVQPIHPSHPSTPSPKGKSHHHLSTFKRGHSGSAGTYFSRATNSTLAHDCPLTNDIEHVFSSNQVTQTSTCSSSLSHAPMAIDSSCTGAINKRRNVSDDSSSPTQSPAVKRSATGNDVTDDVSPANNSILQRSPEDALAAIFHNTGGVSIDNKDTSHGKSLITSLPLPPGCKSEDLLKLPTKTVSQTKSHATSSSHLSKKLSPHKDKSASMKTKKSESLLLSKTLKKDVSKRGDRKVDPRTPAGHSIPAIVSVKSI